MTSNSFMWKVFTIVLHTYTYARLLHSSHTYLTSLESYKNDLFKDNYTHVFNIKKYKIPYSVV